jgi:hypothetical protein
VITNQNYNPEKLAYYTEENKRQRYEQEKRRRLVDMAIRRQDPSYRVTPDELEGVVDISDGEK